MGKKTSSPPYSTLTSPDKNFHCFCVLYNSRYTSGFLRTGRPFQTPGGGCHQVVDHMTS
jgi:hypothetical protein